MELGDGYVKADMINDRLAKTRFALDDNANAQATTKDENLLENFESIEEEE